MTVYFENKKAIYFSVSRPIGFGMSPSLMKDLMNNLIIKYGFTLKKSELISGNDILIREDENCFMIAKIFSKYDDAVAFNIQTYSKN